MKVLFTGGGSAGHVTPNIALIAELRQRGGSAVYVGGHVGIERELIVREGTPYRGIRTGKLRRYFSWQNFIDPFNVLVGLIQACIIMLRERPDVVFSKGGFVSVPVVFAAWLFRVPAVCHESDIVPGLANRLCRPFCRLICINFPETAAYVPNSQTQVTGTPLRADILTRDPNAARTRLRLESARPVLMVFGGSLGAGRINAALAASLPTLLERYEVIHVAGEGAVPSKQPVGYHAFEYIHEGFGDLLELADIVVCRAGANSLYELLVLRKPNVLIPLSASASRGDQVVNARVMAQAGYSRVIADEALDGASLIAAVAQVEAEQAGIMAALAAFPAQLDGAVRIVDLLAGLAGGGELD